MALNCSVILSVARVRVSEFVRTRKAPCTPPSPQTSRGFSTAYSTEISASPCSVVRTKLSTFSAPLPESSDASAPQFLSHRLRPRAPAPASQSPQTLLARARRTPASPAQNDSRHAHDSNSSLRARSFAAPGSSSCGDLNPAESSSPAAIRRTTHDAIPKQASSLICVRCPDRLPWNL